MPLIMPIKDLRNTSEISVLAHEKQEPIFITKNGYSDLVVMSAELYDRFAMNNRINQVIYEGEEEFSETGASIDLDEEELQKSIKKSRELLISHGHGELFELQKLL